MSDYNDFWFVETRNKPKNLKRWFLWAVLLFIFVTVCTYVCVKSMYLPIKNCEIQTENPVVKITEAKKTNANGYINGTVENKSETEVKDKYIKFAFYSKNDINLGNEYVKINTLSPNETKTYEMKFKYSNVERILITISDNEE